MLTKECNISYYYDTEYRSICIIGGMERTLCRGENREPHTHTHTCQSELDGIKNGSGRVHWTILGMNFMHAVKLHCLRYIETDLFSPAKFPTKHACASQFFIWHSRIHYRTHQHNIIRLFIILDWNLYLFGCNAFGLIYTRTSIITIDSELNELHIWHSVRFYIVAERLVYDVWLYACDIRFWFHMDYKKMKTKN